MGFRYRQFNNAQKKVILLYRFSIFILGIYLKQ